MILHGLYMDRMVIWTTCDHIRIITDQTWSLCDHIWTIYDHINGPYMIIYMDHIWSLWSVYDHRCSIHDHIWSVYDHMWTTHDHIWTVYDPTRAMCTYLYICININIYIYICTYIPAETSRCPKERCTCPKERCMCPRERCICLKETCIWLYMFQSGNHVLWSTWSHLTRPLAMWIFAIVYFGLTVQRCLKLPEGTSDNWKSWQSSTCGYLRLLQTTENPGHQALGPAEATSGGEKFRQCTRGYEKPPEATSDHGSVPGAICSELPDSTWIYF